MAAAASAGYSGKPLWQKLGLKDGTRLYVADRRDVVGIEARAPSRAGRHAVIRS